MFPAHAAAKAKAKAGGDKAPMEVKYEKVKGSDIQHLKGGIVVRVATKSGVQFKPDDVEACRKHIEEIKGEDFNKIKANGGQLPKKKKQPKEKKELTPEQIEARKKKHAEQEAKRVAEEARVVDGNKFYAGEVVTRSRWCAWVKPTDMKAIPAKIQTKLKEMNKELRAKAAEAEGKEGKSKPFLEGKDDLVIYVRISDVAEGLKIEPGASVQFKLYTDTKGVGGTEVKA